MPIRNSNTDSSGAAYAWNFDASGGYTVQNLGTVDASWQFAGIGDYLRDGSSEILWRNASGQVQLWAESAARGAFGSEKLGMVDSSWKIQP